MKKYYFDLNTVPQNGFLIFPLSMSRLSNALSAEKIYEFLAFFEAKLSHQSIDVILLYTNGLYLNSDENSSVLRKKLLNQMINHKSSFESMILKKKKFIPGSFHYLPWDYAILNASKYNDERARLAAHFNDDLPFRKALQYDLNIAGQKATEANLQYLLEELIISHLITEKEISFPHRLAHEDGWRLLCYPGFPPVSLVYLWQKNLLGNRNDLSKTHQVFARSLYHMEDRVLIDFKQFNLEVILETITEEENHVFFNCSF